MPDSNFMDVQLRDLHLLQVMLSEGSLTRAAALLDTTQPTLSKALARLRLQLGDPLLVRDGLLAASLPLLRSRGLSALPVTYIGKAATFALMSGFPLVLLGTWNALWSRVIGACGWAFLIWGMYAYLWAFVLYAVQIVLVVRRMPKLEHQSRQPVSRKADDHG